MISMRATDNTTHGDVLILLAALIWGIAFYFQKTAMDHIEPLLFLGLRGLVAATVLLPFVWVEQRRVDASHGNVVPLSLAAGAIFFVAGAVQQFGIVTATVTNAGFLTALYVVVTPFVFWVVRRKAISATVWIAVALSFVGMWTLGGGSVGGFNKGDAMITASALGWALLIVITGEAGRYAQPLKYTFFQFMVMAVLGLASAALFEPVSISAIVDAADSILFVGVLSSALTFGLMAAALRQVPAPRASILLSVETVFAAIAGYVLLGERLTPIGWLGAGLILAAVFVVRLKR